jgi:hypothetical protein
MNQDQYEDICHRVVSDPVITVADLQGPDRTLLYGYDVDRNTWHVFLLDGEIHRVTEDGYGGPTTHLSNESWTIVDLIPNKRAYPERTDYQFARFCVEHGEPITFTTFKEGIEPQQFYGPIR